uniref:Gnk2-homologous domain-containing protein n=1 Tax=Oryza punctata TaxID=4537 RepID=A0A0E0JKA6_ORYPU
MQPLLLLFLSPVVVLLSSSAWTARGEDEAVAVASPEVNPLHYNCSLSGGKYDPNSTFEANLKTLAVLLVAEAKASNFATESFGRAPDAAHGVALCRGDFTGDACGNGLRRAFQDAIEYGLFCPGYKDVTVFYDQHMLRFSNQDFRPSRTNAPAWVAWNMNDVTGADAAARFGSRVMELINATADFAAWNSTSRYATGEAGFMELDVSKVYAAVQCTADLPPADCRRCVDGIASQMSRWFSSASGYRVGGRILSVRCNLRYEVDRFFQESKDTIKIYMPRSSKGTYYL